MFESKNDNIFLYLKDLLSELYSLDEIIFEYFKNLTQNIRIPISYNDLRNKLGWYSLLGKSQDYNQIILEYKKALQSWQQKIDDFDKYDDMGQFDKFIKQYYNYPNSMLKKRKISKEKLKTELLNLRPKISQYFKKTDFSYQNILIHEGKSFHITLHINLSKKLTNTYNLLIIVAMWFDNPNDMYDLSLDYINSIYNDLMIGNDILNKLQSLGYSKEPLFDVNKYNPEKYSGHDIVNLWVKRRPYLFITNALKLLNANPFKLIDDLISHLSQIDDIIQNNIKNAFESPQQYYKNLSNKLKNFLIKGKELFQIAEKSYDYISSIKQEKIPEIKFSGQKEKKSGLTSQKLLFLFKKALEKDVSEKIDAEDRGYRSLKQIYDDYGEDNNFSQQTVYNCFKDSNLESLLESRDRKGRGGGIEYRYLEPPTLEKVDKEDLDETFMKEKMMIEEAIIYYNKKEIDNSIKIFHKVLKIPSLHLKKNINIYYGSLYYLGKSYYKKKMFEKAIGYFQKIFEEQPLLFDARYFLLKCQANFGNYDDKLTFIEQCINDIVKVFKKYGILIDYKHLLSPNKISFYDEEAKNFFKNIPKQDDLTQFITSINSEKISSRGFISVRNIEELSYYTKNINAYEKLCKTLAYALAMKVEILRIKIYFLIVKNQKSEVEKSLTELFDLIKSELYEAGFYKDRFYHYIKYFKNILENYPIEYDLDGFTKLIDEKFPNYKDEDYKYSYYPVYYRESIKRIKDSVLTINGYYNKYTREFLSPSIEPVGKLESDKELKMELEITCVILTEKYKILESYLEELGNKIEYIKTNGDLEIYELMDLRFDFSSPHSKFVSANVINDYIKSTNKMTEEYCLEDFSLELNTMYDGIIKKVNKINDLRDLGKKLAVNKIFEILSENYRYDKREITLSFDKSQEEYEDTIYAELSKSLNEIYTVKNQNIICNLNFIDKEVKTWAIKSLNLIYNSMYTRPFVLDLAEGRTSESLKLSMKSVFKYCYGDLLEDNIEQILYNLTKTLESNLSEFFIEYNAEKEESDVVDLQERLQSELINNYFNFKFERIAETNELKITIEEIQKSNFKNKE